MVAELRFLGWTLAVAAAIVAVASAIVAVGVVIADAHLSPLASGLIVAGALSIAVLGGLLLLAAWLRSLAAKRTIPPRPPNPPAPRYMPFAVNAVVAGWLIYALIGASAGARRHEAFSTDMVILDAFVLIFISAGPAYALYRKLTGRPAAVPFRQDRLEQLQAAYAQPTFAEYRRTIAPLRNRGYIRLGLILLEIAAFAVLAPLIGLGFALLASVGSAMAIFLIAHKLWDL